MKNNPHIYPKIWLVISDDRGHKKSFSANMRYHNSIKIVTFLKSLYVKNGTRHITMKLFYKRKKNGPIEKVRKWTFPTNALENISNFTKFIEVFNEILSNTIHNRFKIPSHKIIETVSDKLHAVLEKVYFDKLFYEYDASGIMPPGSHSLSYEITEPFLSITNKPIVVNNNNKTIAELFELNGSSVRAINKETQIDVADEVDWPTDLSFDIHNDKKSGFSEGESVFDSVRITEKVDQSFGTGFENWSTDLSTIKDT